MNGSWTYGYDEFNRLVSAGKSGQTFGYEYDRYGNRWHQNVTAGSGPAPQYTLNAGNRIAQFTYDVAGNVTNDGSHTYTYDAEGRMTAVGGGSTATYAYDAQGRRVRAVVNGTGSNFIYDLEGHAVAMVNDSGTWVRGEVWSPLGDIATYVWGTTFFNHTDWLGTLRAQSNASGGSAQQCAGLPFGDGLSCTNSDDSPVHFTGLERDAESAVAAGTGLDHAWFRQYSSTQGRWMTPDPAGMAVADPANPQSWNRYAYVMNRPTMATDPLGLFCGPSGCPAPEDNNPGGGWGDPFLLCGLYAYCGPAVPVPINLERKDDPDTWNPRPPVLKRTSVSQRATSDPCANAALSAAGVNIRQNIAEANVAVALGYAAGSINPVGPPDPLGGLVGALYSYDQLVHTGGPQDVKNQPGPGTKQQRVDAGNISFGVTCPFGARYCQFSAGLAQTLSGHPNPNGTLLTGFDTPSDNAAIRIGQAMRAAGCHE